MILSPDMGVALINAAVTGMNVNNVSRLLRDREVRGFNPWTFVLYASINSYNLFFWGFYSHWWAFYSGIPCLAVSVGYAATAYYLHRLGGRPVR